jgi:hypothetical protein
MLDVHYLSRRQEFVAVNRNDLEDLRDYDNSALSFGGFGLALMSGAFFLFLEQCFDKEVLSVWNEFTTFLAFFFGVGAFLAWQGTKMHDKKRDRVSRILDETEESVNSGTPRPKTGKNAASR